MEYTVRLEDETYIVTADDLLEDIRKVAYEDTVEAVEWLENILEDRERIHLAEGEKRIIRDRVLESDVLYYVYEELLGIYWKLTDEEKPEENRRSYYKKLIDALESWIQFKEYPFGVCYQIASQFDEITIEQENYETQQLFREALSALCKENVPMAIQRRGACYYLGSGTYPNDYERAENAFLKYYDLTGDAAIGGMLGDIYYYGHTNGGSPKYKEAFYYYSIGNTQGYTECTYRLADLFLYGQGVKRNRETAFQMYHSVYCDNLRRFRTQDATCRFAEISLRMGNYWREMIKERRDLKKAYNYYLQADLAIKSRMQKTKRYADRELYSDIQKALGETREELQKMHALRRKEQQEEKKKIIKSCPFFTQWVLMDHHTCSLEIKKGKHRNYTLKMSPLPYTNMAKSPDFLVTIPKYDFCALIPKIKIKTSEGSDCTVSEKNDKIIFNYIKYDETEKKTTFYMNRQSVCEIITETYSFKVPDVEEIEISAEYMEELNLQTDMRKEKAEPFVVQKAQIIPFTERSDEAPVLVADFDGRNAFKEMDEIELLPDFDEASLLLSV